MVAILGSIGIVVEDCWGGLEFVAFRELLLTFKAACSKVIQILR